MCGSFYYFIIIYFYYVSPFFVRLLVLLLMLASRDLFINFHHNSAFSNNIVPLLLYLFICFPLDACVFDTIAKEQRLVGFEGFFSDVDFIYLFMACLLQAKCNVEQIKISQLQRKIESTETSWRAAIEDIISSHKRNNNCLRNKIRIRFCKNVVL